MNGRPLREVVSWNTQKTVDVNHFGVDLFVRSWVEIWNGGYRPYTSYCRPLREVVSWNVMNKVQLHISVKSTSSWGRELKYKLTELNNWIYERRPLREVVSWNANVVNPMIGVAVDLFVRSWVEIFMIGLDTPSPSCRPLREVVSWNVNLTRSRLHSR